MNDEVPVMGYMLHRSRRTHGCDVYQHGFPHEAFEITYLATAGYFENRSVDWDITYPISNLIYGDCTCTIMRGLAGWYLRKNL